MTVAEKEQVSPEVVVHWTAVWPTGKNDPEAGLHVTVPQLPMAVGAG